MDVDAAIAWVEDHIDYGSWAARSGRTSEVDLSLDRMRRFVHVLGDPQASMAIIHVSGTNGKGSTAKIITRLLMGEGLRVATYSSPHLTKYNERFRIDDINISDADLAAALDTVADAEIRLGERAMPFELLTAAAYGWFAREHVDVAVIEVGVLGRFDATNVADGRVAVITNIGFDHTNGEGDWRQRIAAEKAGIVKPGAHLILGPIAPRLTPAFRAQRPGHVWRLGREIEIIDDAPTGTGRRLSVETPLQRAFDIDLPLHGAHQTANCALAIAATNAFLGRALDIDHVARALAAVSMPARLERMSAGPNGTGPVVVIDGAHNPDAAAALARALRDDVPRTGRRTLIIGLLGGRDPHAMLDAIEAATFDEIIACTPPTTRARSAAELVEAAVTMGCPTRAIDDIGDALADALAKASVEDQIVVTGSIYLVAAAREWLTRPS